MWMRNSVQHVVYICKPVSVVSASIEDKTSLTDKREWMWIAFRTHINATQAALRPSTPSLQPGGTCFW